MKSQRLAVPFGFAGAASVLCLDVFQLSLRLLQLGTDNGGLLRYFSHKNSLG